MKAKLELAQRDDAAEIAALRNTVADDLTARHGKGFWSGQCTVKGVLAGMRQSKVYIARHRERIVATLVLATKKPWAIDRAYFSPVKRPLYLTSMAVAPDRHLQGMGRLCLEEARKIAASFPVEAIFLDAFNATAGARKFYEKCGYRETGRVTYRRVPLIYYELLV